MPTAPPAFATSTRMGEPLSCDSSLRQLSALDRSAAMVRTCGVGGSSGSGSGSGGSGSGGNISIYCRCYLLLGLGSCCCCCWQLRLQHCCWPHQQCWLHHPASRLALLPWCEAAQPSTAAARDKQDHGGHHLEPPGSSYQLKSWAVLTHLYTGVCIPYVCCCPVQLLLGA